MTEHKDRTDEEAASSQDVADESVHDDQVTDESAGESADQTTGDENAVDESETDVESTSSEQSQAETESSARPDDRKEITRTKLVIALVVAFVVGLVISGFWSSSKIGELRSQLAQIERKAAAQAETLHAQSSRDAAALAEQLAAELLQTELETIALAERLDALGHRVTDMEQARPQALVAAEVEYLIGLANNRLVIERDLPGALMALDGALARLQDVESPAYVALVGAIVADRARLEAVEAPNRGAIVAEISQLIALVDGIQVDAEKLTPDAQSPEPGSRSQRSWQGFLSAVQGNLRQFVRFDKAPGASAPTLIPDHYYYARENIRLSLHNARTAALRSDTANYQLSLAEASGWLERLPADDPAVVALLVGIAEAQQLTLDVAYPGLEASMAMASQVSARHDAPATTEPAATPDESAPEVEQAVEESAAANDSGTGVSVEHTAQDESAETAAALEPEQAAASTDTQSGEDESEQ